MLKRHPLNFTKPLLLIQLIAALFLSPAIAFAVTVCPSGCDFNTIAGALDDVASTGQDVFVDPGTYTEGDLTVVNRTLISTSPNSPASTVIDGSGVNAAVISSASNAGIRGFTITGGNQTGAPGGGIRVTGGTVILEDLIIENNATDLSGGGVGTNTGSSEVIILETVIRDNVAVRQGGGIYWNVDGAISISNSQITGNRVTGGLVPVTASGGGIYRGNFSSLVIENTSISGNTLEASQRNFGAGIFTSANSTSLLNATVSNNTANAATTTSQGGGIYFSVSAGRTLELTGATINANNAESAGGGLFCTLSISGSVTVPSGSISGNGPEDIAGCFPPVVTTDDTPADYEQGGTDADPVSTFTGDLFNQYPTDINLGGPMPLFFARYYSSALIGANINGTLGDNWRHNFEWTLARIDTEISIVNHHGRLIEFTDNGSSWDLAGKTDVVYQLVEGVGQFTLLDPRNHHQYTFNTLGYLISTTDGKGNTHTLTYDASNQLDQVADGLGRTLFFTYNGSGQLATVSDGSRTVTLTYSSTDLSSVTDANGDVTAFAYDPGALMTSTTLPEGNVPFSQTWNGSGQVVTQTDSDGDTYSFSYTGANTNLTDPLSGVRVHTHTASGELSNRQDQAGLSFSMGSDTTGRRSSVSDRLGDSATFSHHQASGKLSSRTHADLSSTSFTYTARIASGLTNYDLSGITHADGETETFVYDASGNLEFHTDQAGNTRSATYNGNGQPLTVTNTVGGTTTMIYNGDGTRSSTTDSAGNVTSYGYDALDRLNLATFADTSAAQFSYDDEDRLLSTTDENGNTTSFSYDNNDNLATITSPLGLITTFTYDGNDRLASTIDPLGSNNSNGYDSLGRLSSTTDKNGNSVTYGYDSRDRVTTITGPGGDVQTLAYDDEAVIASSTDPLGNTTQFTTDQLGRVTRVTGPLGDVHDINYDSMGRVVASTDPLGNTTNLGREARGLLSAITLPGGISTSYARNALGQITTRTDSNGNNWLSSFDNQGRRSSRTDPLGNVIGFAYDNRNRTSSINFPGALGSGTLSYDVVGNLTQAAYSDGTTTTFSYDADNRLVNATGVSRGYDANGQITLSNGITIGRDPGGRVTSVTLAPGNTVTYGYDANDNLTQISDWTGGITNLTYDIANRPTGITRPNGITTNYTHDGNNRLVGITDGTLSSITLVRDAKGQITNATRNVPEALAVSQLSSLPRSFDAASQVASDSFDGLGRLTDDGARTYVWRLDSRLLSYSQGASTTSFSYDAMGRRLTRTDAGVTREYVWNDGLELPSISIERESGADIRYYIHTPDGRLRYSIDAADNSRRNYHFDEMGNTLFLSDSGGNVIASYAYSPYGDLLNSSGSVENAFTWQGELGAMQENDGLYYLRARYYDSNGGRFISRDPVRLIQPLEINPYQYAVGNPLRFVDPTGTRGEYRPRSIASDVAQERRRQAAARVKRLEAWLAYRRDSQNLNSEIVQQQLARDERILERARTDLEIAKSRTNLASYMAVEESRNNLHEFARDFHHALSHEEAKTPTEAAEPINEFIGEDEALADTIFARELQAPESRREANDLHGLKLPETPSLPPPDELRDLMRIYQENTDELHIPFGNEPESCVKELNSIVVLC